MSTKKPVRAPRVSDDELLRAFRVACDAMGVVSRGFDYKAITAPIDGDKYDVGDAAHVASGLDSRERKRRLRLRAIALERLCSHALGLPALAGSRRDRCQHDDVFERRGHRA